MNERVKLLENERSLATPCSLLNRVILLLARVLFHPCLFVKVGPDELLRLDVRMLPDHVEIKGVPRFASVLLVDAHETFHTIGDVVGVSVWSIKDR